MKQKMILGLSLFILITGALAYYFFFYTYTSGIIEEDLPPSNKF